MPVSPSRALTALRVPALLVALATAGTAAAPGLLPAFGADRHRVVLGDTLWELALASGSSVAELKRLNGLRSDTIIIGQLLSLPGAAADDTAGATSTSTATGATATTTTYVVRSGDTLTAIAGRAGTTQTVLRALNPLPDDGTVLLGQRLRLPLTVTGGSGAGTTADGSPSAVLTTGEGPLAPTSSAYVAAVGRSRDLLAAQPWTSAATAQALIRSAALRQGVDPSLALAVAYQESGFTHALVSRTDAVGVMQLMPATAAWLGPALLGRSIDRYDVRDNIAGGVALLAALLRVADTRTAVAAYYQGLARTRSRGMLPDTRLYVASVLALQSRFS